MKSVVEFIPDTETKNVVGTLPGHSTDEILFLAHLDTVYNTQGANDNTASVIAMLMLAHSVSGIKPQKTLTFVATEGEEYNKLGAINYAERRKRAGTYGNIKFLVNFDGNAVFSLTEAKVNAIAYKKLDGYIGIGYIF